MTSPTRPAPGAGGATGRGGKRKDDKAMSEDDLFSAIAELNLDADVSDAAMRAMSDSDKSVDANDAWAVYRDAELASNAAWKAACAADGVAWDVACAAYHKADAALLAAEYDTTHAEAGGPAREAYSVAAACWAAAYQMLHHQLRRLGRRLPRLPRGDE